MHISVRSHLIAGVAFVGVGALALMPVAPAAPAVELRAVVSDNVAVYEKYRDPVKVWTTTLQESVSYTTEIGKGIFTDPAPVLKEVVKSQIYSTIEVFKSVETAYVKAVPAVAEIPEALLTAMAQLARGDVQGAATTLFDPVLTLGLAVLEPGAAVVEAVRTAVADLSAAVGVLTDPDTLRAVVLAATGPVLSAVNALIDSAGLVVDGLSGGDLGAVVNALVNLPADLTGAILNGHGTGLGGVKAVGLLTPYDPELKVAGPLAAVQVIRVAIGEAIAGVPNSVEPQPEPEPAEPAEPEPQPEPEPEPTTPGDKDGDTIVIGDGDGDDDGDGTIVIDDGDGTIVIDDGDGDGGTTIVIEDGEKDGGTTIDDGTTIVIDDGEVKIPVDGNGSDSDDGGDYVVIDDNDGSTTVDETTDAEKDVTVEDDGTTVTVEEDTYVTVKDGSVKGGSDKDGDTFGTDNDDDNDGKTYVTADAADTSAAVGPPTRSGRLGVKRADSGDSVKAGSAQSDSTN